MSVCVVRSGAREAARSVLATLSGKVLACQTLDPREDVGVLGCAIAQRHRGLACITPDEGFPVMDLPSLWLDGVRVAVRGLESGGAAVDPAVLGAAYGALHG